MFICFGGKFRCCHRSSILSTFTISVVVRYLQLTLFTPLFPLLIRKDSFFWTKYLFNGVARFFMGGRQLSQHPSTLDRFTQNVEERARPYVSTLGYLRHLSCHSYDNEDWGNERKIQFKLHFKFRTLYFQLT